MLTTEVFLIGLTSSEPRNTWPLLDIAKLRDSVPTDTHPTTALPCAATAPHRAIRPDALMPDLCVPAAAMACERDTAPVSAAGITDPVCASPGDAIA